MATVTDADGHYSFALLGPGVWDVEVTMFGFQPLQEQVNYSSTDKAVNFQLKLAPPALAQRFQRLAGSRPAAANQTDTEIQEALNSNQSEARPPTSASAGDTNESFLVSGSLSQGLAPNAPPDTGSQESSTRQRGRGQQTDGAGAQQSGSAPGFGGAGAGAGGGRGGFGGGRFGGGAPRRRDHLTAALVTGAGHPASAVLSPTQSTIRQSTPSRSPSRDKTFLSLLTRRTASACCSGVR